MVVNRRTQLRPNVFSRFSVDQVDLFFLRLRAASRKIYSIWPFKLRNSSLAHAFSSFHNSISIRSGTDFLFVILDQVSTRIRRLLSAGAPHVSITQPSDC